ncbi:MAG: hypothetical protein WBO37_13995 [Gammaproteobacteria bacterium]
MKEIRQRPGPALLFSLLCQAPEYAQTCTPDTARPLRQDMIRCLQVPALPADPFEDISLQGEIPITPFPDQSGSHTSA